MILHQAGLFYLELVEKQTTFGGVKTLNMYFHESEGEGVKENVTGEDGQLSFLGLRLTFKVDNGLGLYFQQLLIYSSKLKKQATNLLIVTQHPDSNPDIVEMVREEDGDDEHDEDNEDNEEEEFTSADSFEEEWKKMGL